MKAQQKAQAAANEAQEAYDLASQAKQLWVTLKILSQNRTNSRATILSQFSLCMWLYNLRANFWAKTLSIELPPRSLGEMEKVDNLTQSIDDYMTGDKATPEQVQELAEEVTNVFWRKSTLYNFLYKGVKLFTPCPDHSVMSVQ